VFGVAFSVVLGAETLTLRIVFGFALVFAAIIISEVLPERAKR
jgi:drug/metabolite transporter (DMT)-like permease